MLGGFHNEHIAECYDLGPGAARLIAMRDSKRCFARAFT